VRALNGTGSDDMKSVEAAIRVEGRGWSVEGTRNSHEFFGAMGWRTVPSPSLRPSPLGRGRAPADMRCPSLDTAHSPLANRHSSRGTRLAFTLIELLVVIGIMAILAALIIPITGAVTRHKLRSRTKTEFREIEMAIENYKTKKGYYPPDNPGNQFYLNQLYYELSGTVASNGVYTTLDGNGVLDPAQANPFMYGKGFQGLVNTTKGAGDEGMAANKFLRELKPAQVATLGPLNSAGIKILVGSVGWDSPIGQPIPPAPAGPARVPKLNPFRYVSTNPTNNPGKFDLWIDILVQGKTNRICNWSDDVIVL
jgi:prepilin-type N-terminal cleavage/methylation domain-containing protein